MAQSIEQMTSTWQVLNLALLNADEQLANQMLDAEKAGKKRTRFMLRIHSRINKLRADRERIEIERLEYAPAPEQLANQMLDAEKAGKKRARFMLRIHSRINKLRADRKRIEIERLEYAPAPEPKRAVKKAKAVAPEPAPPPVLAKKPSAKKTVGAQ